MGGEPLTPSGTQSRLLQRSPHQARLPVHDTGRNGGGLMGPQLKVASAWVLVLIAPATLVSQNPPPTPPPTQPPVVQTPTQPTAAQQAAQQATGRAVTNEQISTAIRNSGLSLDQVQQRLRQAGYDPSLANPFFAQAQGAGGAAGAPGQPAPSNDFVQALQTLGILNVPTSTERPEETPHTSSDRPSGRAGGVFGKDVFTRTTTVF